jgi:beta-lactamase superfamily II metal-dependent hydrolase
MPSVTGEATVQRFKNGKLVDQKPLSEAIAGPTPWLQLHGVNSDSATRLAVTATQGGYDISIDVKGLVIAGAEKNDVKAAHSAWTANKNLMLISEGFDALRTVLTPSSKINVEILNKLEEARQNYEWDLFGDDPAGADIPSGSIDVTDAANTVSNLVASGGTDLDQGRVNPDKNLRDFELADWVEFNRGTSLSKSELDNLAAAMHQIGIAVAKDRPAPSNETSALLMQVAALHGLDIQNESVRPDDFGSYIPEDPVRFHDYREESVGSREWRIFRDARTIGQVDFNQALRLAAFSRFDQRDSFSGRIWYETLRNLHCESVFGSTNKFVAVNGEHDNSKIFHSVTSLAQSIGIYSPAVPSDSVVKITIRQDKACFEWISESAEILREVIPIDDLSKEALDKFGKARFVIDEEDDESADALDDFDIEVETVEAARSADAAKALVLPGSSSSTPADYELKAPQRVRDDMVSIPGTDVALLHLDSHGDCQVVRLADGSLVVVDTGLSASTVKKLEEFLARNYQVEKPPIRLVITHTDRDHIGGLATIIKEGFEVDEIVIGRSVSESPDGEQIRRVVSALDMTNYSKTDGPSLTHFVRKDLKKPLIDPLHPSRVVDNAHSWYSYPAKDTIISLHHVVDSNSTNGAGFLVQISARGTNWLLTDDLTGRSLETLGGSLPASELKSGLLKWPHHLWLPKNGSKERVSRERERLTEFIRSVMPHTIVFSNTGHVTHDEKRYEEIKDYVASIMGERTINFFWTDSVDANLSFKMALRPSPAVPAFPFAITSNASKEAHLERPGFGEGTALASSSGAPNRGQPVRPVDQVQFSPAAPSECCVASPRSAL